MSSKCCVALSLRCPRLRLLRYEPYFLSLNHLTHYFSQAKWGSTCQSRRHVSFVSYISMLYLSRNFMNRSICIFASFKKSPFCISVMKTQKVAWVLQICNNGHFILGAFWVTMDLSRVKGYLYTYLSFIAPYLKRLIIKRTTNACCVVSSRTSARGHVFSFRQSVGKQPPGCSRTVTRPCLFNSLESRGNRNNQCSEWVSAIIYNSRLRYDLVVISRLGVWSQYKILKGAIFFEAPVVFEKKCCYYH